MFSVVTTSMSRPCRIASASTAAAAEAVYNRRRSRRPERPGHPALVGIGPAVHTPSVVRGWLFAGARTVAGSEGPSSAIQVVGGAAWLLVGSLVLAVAVLSLIVGAAPSGQVAYLQSLADHATAADLIFTLFAIADVLLVPALLALYPALVPAGKTATLVGTGLIGLWAVQDLVLTEATSLALVALARDYATATAGARSAILLAARYPLALLPVATFLSYVVSSAGLLLIGAVMLRSAFPRGIGLLALIASVEGLVGAFYVVVPGLSALLTPSLVTFGLWAIVAGVALLRHGGSGRRATAAPRTR